MTLARIVGGLALGLAAMACVTTTSAPLGAQTAGAFTTEPLWDKPAGGCPPGTFDRFERCAVCDFAERPPYDECRKRCDAGNGDACTLLALRLDWYTHFGPNNHEVTSLEERACALGSGSGCEGLANLLIRGRGIAKDERRAADLADAMCSAGRKRACMHLGEWTLAGRGVPLDQARGLSLLDDACHRGAREACLVRADPRVTTDIDAARKAALDVITESMRTKYAEDGDTTADAGARP